MATLGGVGSFAQGFATSFQRGMSERRQREQDTLRQRLQLQKEQRMEKQFREQQDLRQEQFEALTEYRQGQQQLQQKQLELNQRSADLQAWGAWDKVLDPAKSPASRKFMAKQLAATLGINQKSQQYKDFEQYITAEDDDKLKEIREGLAAMAPGATPGQIQAISKGIMSGTIQMKDVLGQFAELSKTKRVGEIMGGVEGEPPEEPAAEGVPTRQVQTQRLTSPEPIARQPMGPASTVQIPPGGTLPVPGMTRQEPAGPAEQPTSEDLKSQAVELFGKARQLVAEGFREEGSVINSQAASYLQFARDMEAGKQMELKQIVDPSDPNKEIWVREELAEFQQAPSARPVKTVAEERATAEAKGITELELTEIVKPIIQDAQSARQLQPQLQLQKQAIKSGKFVPGSLGNLRSAAAQFAKLLGVPEDITKSLEALGIGDPAIAETISTSHAMIATSLAERMSRVTNMSLGLVTEAVPGLLKTPEGNLIAIELLERSNSRAFELERLRHRYIEDYGTLRPEGKPSFFEQADRLRSKPLVEEGFLDRMKKEAAKGNAVDVDKLADSFRSKNTLKIGKDTYSVKDQTEKGLPIIEAEGATAPYVASKKDLEKITPDITFYFVFVDGQLQIARRKQ